MKKFIIFTVLAIVFILVIVYFKNVNQKPAPILPGEEITYERVQELEKYEQSQSAQSQPQTETLEKPTPVSEEDNDPELNVNRGFQNDKVDDYVVTELGVTTEQLSYMRQLGFNNRAIMVTAHIAKQKDLPIEDVIKKKTGKPPVGWGRMVHDYKLDHRKFNQEVRSGYNRFVNKQRQPKLKK